MILANGGVLVLVRGHFPAALRRSAVFWLLGSLCIAIGCAIMSFKHPFSPAIALTLSNGLFVLGLTAYWQSLREYYCYPPNAYLLLPTIVTTLGMVWFTAFEPAIKARIMLVSIAWLTLMGGSLYTMKVQARHDKAVSQRVLMGIFAGVLLFTAARAVYYAQLSMAPGFTIMDNSNWMNLVTTMLAIILPVIGTTAFILMCMERVRQPPAYLLSDDDPAEFDDPRTDTLSYIGHDLRAPLASIVGHARLLSESGTPEQAQHVKAIERSASYQLALIDEILEYARHERKALEIQLAPVRLAGLLNEVILQAHSLCLLQDNRFEFEAGTPLPALVSTDARRLQQVLLNLISNAAKFTRNGLICLTVTAGTENEVFQLVFSLSDTGIGIRPKEQASIFKAFEQVEPRRGGTGLGLYIAQRIVKNMGGVLQLQSTVGEGSRFSFNIPMEQLSTATTTLSETSLVRTSGTSTNGAGTMLKTPAGTLRQLEKLAQNGRLSDIEDWLTLQSRMHPDCAAFLHEVTLALDALDFDLIETLAQTDSQ